MPVKAPLGSSPLMLALQVKTVCTEADVLMLVVASLSIWKKKKKKKELFWVILGLTLGLK